jgi:hypothetical protein
MMHPLLSNLLRRRTASPRHGTDSRVQFQPALVEIANRRCRIQHPRPFAAENDKLIESLQAPTGGEIPADIRFEAPVFFPGKMS